MALCKEEQKGPKIALFLWASKEKKENDPYNVCNLFSLFLKNKINWKIVCLN